LNKFTDISAALAANRALGEPTFCKACGASIPHRIGEGRCPECIDHLPAEELIEAGRRRFPAGTRVGSPDPVTDSYGYMVAALRAITRELAGPNPDAKAMLRVYAIARDALSAAGDDS
jgi:hypothetical protein